MATFIRRTLFWQYAAYFAGLVSALLVVSGAVGGYFAYRESVAALEELQHPTRCGAFGRVVVDPGAKFSDQSIEPLHPNSERATCA